MKKSLTLALCALSVSAFATTPSIEDQMSYPPRPPLLDFPNWWNKMVLLVMAREV